jgi:hypothetical protein
MRPAEEGQPLALSPDGRWALVTAARNIFEVPKWSGFRVVPIGAGEARSLAVPGLVIRGADWVPDGKRILVYGREANRGWQVFLLDATTLVTVTPDSTRRRRGLVIVRSENALCCRDAPTSLALRAALLQLAVVRQDDALLHER